MSRFAERGSAALMDARNKEAASRYDVAADAAAVNLLGALCANRTA